MHICLAPLLNIIAIFNKELNRI